MKKFSVIALLIFVTLLGAATWWLALQVRDVKRLATHYPEIRYAKKATIPTVTFVAKRPTRWVPLKRISSDALGAIIVSEDWAFYQHEGFDVKQLRESLETNLKHKRFVRGGSTITQQVVRNVFLSREKTLQRKFHELVLAVLLEQYVAKNRILEIYVNIAEWGDGIYGIGAASQHYFQKPPADINPKEAAFLAMLLPSPKRYALSYRKQELTPFAKRSIENILSKMVQAGFITREQADEESVQHLAFERDEVDIFIQ